MSITIEREAFNALGVTEQEFAAAVSDFAAAREAHKDTVGIPAPTAHPWVDLIVRQHGGYYQIESEPEGPEEPEEPEEPKPLPNVPSSYPLTARQLRLGLIRHGIPLSTIENTIDGISDQQERDEARVWWEYTNLIHWDHPMTQTLMALVGVTPENAAAMWLVAKEYAA